MNVTDMTGSALTNERGWTSPQRFRLPNGIKLVTSDIRWADLKHYLDSSLLYPILPVVSFTHWYLIHSTVR